MSDMLKCQECDYTEAIPMHCKQPMHVESVEGKERLVCWMGPSCGVQDIPNHHEKPMQVLKSNDQGLIGQEDVIEKSEIHSPVIKPPEEEQLLEIPLLLSQEAQEANLIISGMTCASCVATVEKGLNKVDGVQSAVVNLMTEKATVRYE